MFETQNKLPFCGLAIPFFQGFMALSISLVTVGALSGCSQSRWKESAPYTGDVISEKQTAQSPPETLRLGEPSTGTIGYVSSDRLRAHTGPDQPLDQTTIVLEQNCKVQVLQTAPAGTQGLVQVRVLECPNGEVPGSPVWIPPQYINAQPVRPTPEAADADKFFMIQNIATEKLRVYERCMSRGCSHRLVLETDMAAGENRPSARTMLGSFRISKWFKFYEDSKNQFPSWYHPNYPVLPPPGADLAAWKSPSLLPNGRGIGRGKFGWYTAHLTPNAEAQWTHGTLGWGADGDRFITMTRDPLVNSESDPRSQGCSRVENQAIAFIREIMPAGSRIIKIYAKEAYRDPSKQRYAGHPQGRFDWLLTKEGVDVDGPKSGRAGTLARNVPKELILEGGSYVIDQMPDAVPFRRGRDGHLGQNGNLYNLNESSLRGHFLVDEGVLIDYAHPRELEVGGHLDGRRAWLPSLVVSREGAARPPHSRHEKERILQRTEGRRQHLGRDVVIVEEGELGGSAQRPPQPHQSSSAGDNVVIYDQAAGAHHGRRVLTGQ